MRPALVSAAVILACSSVASSAASAVLTVPADYPTPCAAVAAANTGDEIDIAAGTYTDTCEITTDGLHLKGVGGQPKIDLTGMSPAQSKGIYIVSGDDITIENLELTGAAVSDGDGGNGAGLRIQGNGAVVTHCFIHDNQDGILATATTGGGTVTIEYTELMNNGLGDACDAASCVHNVYIGTGGGGNYGKLVFQFNWTHALATDTSDKGHLLKSRALESDILYNRITGEGGHDSYEVDLPNGGLGIVVGNVIEKGPNPDNEILLDYGEEGYGTGTNTLYVVSNTFVNDDTSANSPVFIDVAAGGTLTAANDNIFAGNGTVSSTGMLSADNLSGVDPLFVDPSTYDYHLTAGSPAIGKAVSPGSAGSLSLTPVFEYVQPLASAARTADKDVGAFEFGTSSGGGGSDASVGAGDAGGSKADAGKRGDGGDGTKPGADGGSGSAGHADAGKGGSGADGGVGEATGSTGGCGCGVAGHGGGSRWALVGMVFAGLLVGRRRRRSRGRWAAPRCS